MDHVEKIRQICSITQSRFKDRNFSASTQSLYINGTSLSEFTLGLLPDRQQLTLNSSSSIDKIQWLRPDQIVTQELSDDPRISWTVFRDPKPNDVVQGALGDCWFITALSVVAELPEYLTRVNCKICLLYVE